MNFSGYNVVHEAVVLNEFIFNSKVHAIFGKNENSLSSALRRFFRTRVALKECTLQLNSKKDLVIEGVGYITGTGVTVNTDVEVGVVSTKHPKQVQVVIPRKNLTSKTILQDKPKKFAVILNFEPIEIRDGNGKLHEVGSVFVMNSGGWLTRTEPAEKKALVLKNIVKSLGL